MLQQNGSRMQTSDTHCVLPSQPLFSAVPDLHALWLHVPVFGPSHAEHTELMHVLPPLHTVPHEPQFELSVDVSLQLPPQH